MSRFTFLAIAMFVLIGLQTTQGRSEAPSNPGPIKAIMHSFEHEISKLRPYLVSEEKFKSPKAKAEIQKSLETLEKKARTQQPTEIAQNPGFRITFELLADHLRRTQQTFNRGEYEYARMRLNATTNFCMACHTQVPIPKEPFGGLWGSGSDSTKASMSNAEYLFITRRFDLALEKYDELVRSFPKSSVKSDELPDVYRRKLAVFARIQRQPEAAIANLKKDLENKELPPTIRSNIETWITFFEEWKSEKKDPADFDTPKLLAHFKKMVPEAGFRKIAPADPNVVNYLRLSGLLYERLLKESEGPNTQEILYDLATCEKHLSPLYWYSLSDVYLFQCVMNYPQKPFTRKCFDAYQTNMEERYNRGGMPEDIKASLESMKKYL